MYTFASAIISGYPSIVALQMYFPVVCVSTVSVRFAVFPTRCKNHTICMKKKENGP